MLSISTTVPKDQLMFFLKNLNAVYLSMISLSLISSINLEYSVYMGPLFKKSYVLIFISSSAHSLDTRLRKIMKIKAIMLVTRVHHFKKVEYVS